MKFKNTGIKNRLGNSNHAINANFTHKKRPASGVHNRIGFQGSIMKNRLGLTKEPIVTPGDVRHKIIAKKRSQIVDARDRLAEIAKQEDARVKLNKRKIQKNNVRSSNSFEVPKKTVIVRKTVINKKVKPQIGLDGNKFQHSGALIRTVTGNQSLKLNKPKTQYSPVKENPNRYHPLKNNPNVVTIRNERASLPQRNIVDHRSMNPKLRGKRANVSSIQQRPPVFDHNSAPLYQERPPVFESQSRYAAPVSSYQKDAWGIVPKTNMSQTIRPTQLAITTTNDYMDQYGSSNQFIGNNELESRSIPFRAPATKRPSYHPASQYDDDDEEYMPAPPKKQAVLSSNMISRLSSSLKVMVTNLHRVVTLEDVEELFGSIGPIKSARIIRDGIAEIVFEHDEDAFKSVEVYHNRQLDGKAMSVTVVTKKPASIAEPSSYRQRFSPPTVSPPIRRRQPAPPVRSITKSVLRDASGSSSQAHQSHKKGRHNDVAPDLEAIHEALFKAKNALAAANQQFFINVPHSNFK